MADTTSTKIVTFRAYIVKVTGAQHNCTYIVVASTRVGADAIARDSYDQAYGKEDPATQVEVVNTIEPASAYCVYDNYDDIDFEFPEM